MGVLEGTLLPSAEKTTERRVQGQDVGVFLGSDLGLDREKYTTGVQGQGNRLRDSFESGLSPGTGIWVRCLWGWI